MRRLVVRRALMLTAIACAIAVLGAIAARHYAHKYQVGIASIGKSGDATPYGSPGHIPRTSVVPPRPAAPSSEGAARHAGQTSMTPEQAQAFYEPSRAVHTVKPAMFFEKLDATVGISPHERDQLKHVFQLAAAMQQAVDTVADKSEQELRQRQLLQQVDVRLRTILLDGTRIDAARGVLSGMPRIEVDT